MNDTTATSTDSQVNETEQTLEKPGALLKEAREREGLSVEEVAKSLYLTKSKVRALESDEYDKLQSHVFIKGYLRKYAPLVGLDAEKLIEHYHHFVGQINHALDELDDTNEEIPNTLVPKFVVPAALFGVAVVVLITLFVFMGDDNSSPATNISPASEIDADLAQRVAANAEPEEEPNLDRELAKEMQEFAQQNPQLTVTDQTSNVQTSNAQNTKSPVVAATENRNASSVNRSSDSENSLVNGPELKFEFAEDCWLEVRDQFDTILYTDVVKAGESVALQGEPPFAISLGNAQAVTLYWGDQEIDTSPKPGYRTNKIVVGAEDATTR